MPTHLRRSAMPLTIRILACWSTVAVVALATCNCVAHSTPDQTQFVSIDDLRKLDEPIARIYAAPIPQLEHMAVHCWFAIKPAGGDVDRWELWQTAGGPYGHVRHNLMSVEGDVGAGGTFVLREWRGTAATTMIETIVNESPNYPCRADYRAYPGPNSNTYVQWVLDRADVDYRLPCAAVGAGYRCED